MSRRLRVTALAVVVVALLAAAVVALLRAGDEPAAVQGLVARTSLAPVAGLFGDAVRAEVDVALDPRRVDPDSVLVAVDFGSLDGPASSEPERTRAGRTVRLRFGYRLHCLREGCRPGEAKRVIQLAPAAVRYRLVDGTARRLRLDWPAAIVVGTRLTEVDSARPVWRVREHPLPPVSYRVPPVLAAAVGYSLAALLALAAVVVLVVEALALLRRRAPDPLAGLTPLERALALLARAVSEGGAAEQRRALDRLARELRRGGADELAADARRLAWSRQRPERERVAALAAAAAAQGSV